VLNRGDYAQAGQERADRADQGHHGAGRGRFAGRAQGRARRSASGDFFERGEPTTVRAGGGPSSRFRDVRADDSSFGDDYQRRRRGFPWSGRRSVAPPLVPSRGRRGSGCPTDTVAACEVQCPPVASGNGIAANRRGERTDDRAGAARPSGARRCVFEIQTRRGESVVLSRHTTARNPAPRCSGRPGREGGRKPKGGLNRLAETEGRPPVPAKPPPRKPAPSPFRRGLEGSEKMSDAWPCDRCDRGGSRLGARGYGAQVTGRCGPSLPAFPRPTDARGLYRMCRLGKRLRPGPDEKGPASTRAGADASAQRFVHRRDRRVTAASTREGFSGRGSGFEPAYAHREQGAKGKRIVKSQPRRVRK